MPNHVCWLCKSNTGHTLSDGPTVLGPEAVKLDAYNEFRPVCAAMTCSICKGQSIAIGSTDQQGRGIAEFFDSARGDALLWRPSATDTKEYPHVPPHIGSAAKEAYECHSCEHYRASIMLARAVIEATAKDNGITTGNLYNKIEAMATAGLIRMVIKDAAHGVRELGNEMAHGDFVDPISAKESQLVIRLMGEILNDVYQSPAAIAQAQQAAQARQQGGQQ